MSEFLHYVLWELKNSFALVLLAGIAAAGILGAANFVHKRKYRGVRKFPWGKSLLWLIFFGYLAVVFYVTNFRASFGRRAVNLHLFRGWLEAWNNFSQQRWLNVLLNIAMFGPFGFLLPLLGKKARKWYVTIPAGFLASLSIEVLQYIYARGVFDVDDLLCNVLGAAMGYFAVLTILSCRNEKGKRLKPAVAYGILAMIPTMAIAGIFLGYEWKEYGNLPCAPAYRNDTKGVSWTLECDFPEVGNTLPVYRTQSRTIGDCDAFAEEFRQIIGTQYNTISYYQQEAYYMDNGFGDGAHFLQVRYMDPGFSYSAHLDDDCPWADADRQTIAKALEKFPLAVPEAAEFVREGDGWHSFTLNRHQDGAILYDGTLRVRYAQDGSIREIESGLHAYTHYSSEAVITPEEAHELLRAGQFWDGGFFEDEAPKSVRVVSCEIAYEIDTKGFYQPVYQFYLVSGDGSYEDRILIPARR